jgi:hypothetical protein
MGYQAGYTNQGKNCISIGTNAGYTGQGGNTGFSVAIGTGAGSIGQGVRSIAMGYQAGSSNQGNDSVAIGNQAGFTGQGQYCIAIGNNAGQMNQPSQSIILNAGITGLNPGTGASGFYVNPINSTGVIGATGALYYEIGTNQIKYDTSKTFVIDHPNDKNKYLVHACLEGPEAGVYYRGKGEIANDKYATVSLPNYVENLAYDFTVQITPIYNGIIKTYNSSDVKNNEFKVYGENGEFFWTVYGKRFNIDVEPIKYMIEVKGDGPYKWI